MAKLFKDKIIKENLKRFEIPDFDQKLEVIQTWKSAYENGSLQQKTETQCEQSFNSDIFIKVLGYTSFPKETYTIQPKDNVETGGGQIPDATLGYFANGVKRVVAVVEIKDVNTSLDKSQRREGNLSPVQQAFKYKPQFKECGFVIATNFYEIRLFRDNQLDYERFTLPELLDSKDDYFQFRKFFYLLSVGNFITEKGQTETEKLLSVIRYEQEKITNKFYKEYKQLRQDLIKDIIENNKIKRLDFYSLVVEKAQKIVDRIVFVSFFEDSGLLPDGKLIEVVEYSQKSTLSEPVWETMKRFFKAIDEGSDRLGIPNGYNGELFKEDEELNKLVIGDDICKRFVDFSKYDFEEDLSVNILGHIFEQSITDLERLKRYSEGKEVGSKDSKRKKDGIFYTPEYIVDYIVKNSLGRYLEEKEQEIFDKHKLDSQKIKKEETYDKKALQAYQEYQGILRNVKVLDPACGSGAFLVKVFDFLLAENKRVSKIIADIQGNASLYDTEDYVKTLLQNNIYGVDLNPESVEITKLSLWLKSAQRGQKLITLKENIKCGNSLIDDPDVASTRAFNWDNEFSEIMKAGGFDVVIGNPPYVFARGGNFNKKEKEYYYSKYKLLNYQINTFLAFIELSFNLLKNKGSLGFIVPNNWLTINSFAPFREFILKNTSDISIYNAIDKVFNQASVDTCLLSFKKDKPNRIILGELNAQEVLVISENKPDVFFDNNYIIRINSAKQKNIKFRNFLLLKEIAVVKSGLKAYEVGKGQPAQTEEMKDNRIYHSRNPQGSEWVKYLEGSDVSRYFLGWSGEYIRYGSNLAAPRTIDLFNSPRIIVRQIPSPPPYCINAIYTNEHIINDINSHVIFNIKNDYSPLYLLGVINSSLLSYWFVNTFDKFQRKIFPQFKVNELEQFPICLTSDEDKNLVSERVKSIIDKTAEFQSKLNKAKELLKHELGVDKLPSKLDSFYELSFDEIIKISKAKLDLNKKSELIDFIEKTKQELIPIKKSIKSLDDEIDHLVYKIYQVTDEEINQVEDFKMSS